MKIVRPGGSVTLPQGDFSKRIYEALMQFDWNDVSKWDQGSPSPSEVVKITGEGPTKQQVKAVWKVRIGKIESIEAKQKRESRVRVVSYAGGK